jgi:hypothetical protein
MTDINDTIQSTIAQDNAGSQYGLVPTSPHTHNGIDSLRIKFSDTELNWVPRMYTATTTASIVPDVTQFDYYEITAQASNVLINNPVVSMSGGTKILISFTAVGGAWTFTFGDMYVGKAGITLPTAMVSGKSTLLGFMYNAGLKKLNLIALGQEA